MITQTLGYINATIDIEQTVHTATDNRRKDKLYYIKQKLSGVILIALGVASVPVLYNLKLLCSFLYSSICIISFGADYSSCGFLCLMQPADFSASRSIQ